VAALRVALLAEPQVLKSASELGLFVDQTRRRARRAAGEKTGRKSYRNNDRFDFHDIFLFSVLNNAAIEPIKPRACRAVFSRFGIQDP
jgi:hypothetical protein